MKIVFICKRNHIAVDFKNKCISYDWPHIAGGLTPCIIIHTNRAAVNLIMYFCDKERYSANWYAD